MTKKELKYYLKLFSKVQKDIEDNKTYSIISIYRRKRKIVLPDWIFYLKNILFTIIKNSDDVIRTIIDLLYFKGFNDKDIIDRLPISESGFYRTKRNIEDLIFDIYISLGFVNKTEIINSWKEEYG